MNGTESEIDASDYFDYPNSEIDAGDINGRERNSNAKSQAKSKGGDGLSTGDIVLISLLVITAALVASFLLRL